MRFFLLGLGLMTASFVALPASNEVELPADKASNQQAALNEWLSLAKQGDAQAQYHLGKLFAKGQGVPENDAKALEWFRKSATQGYADAQLILGVMYLTGAEGLSKNSGLAVEWFYKAAQQGSARAQFLLGNMFLLGRGVPKNIDAGVTWLQNAAEQNNPKAMLVLAKLSEAGVGLPKDLSQAAHWYQQSAQQGVAKAQYALGELYLDGRGVEEDASQAFRWFLKAAEQDHLKAMQQVAAMYQKGLGVEQDRDEAMRWFIASAKQKSEPSQALMEFNARQRKRIQTMKEKLRAPAQRDLEKQSSGSGKERAALSGKEQAAQDAYVKAISEKIMAHWIQPPGSGDVVCSVRINQLPGGEIVSIELLDSCGSPAVDRSVTRAIRRSNPLPMPPRGFRNLFAEKITLDFELGK